VVVAEGYDAGGGRATHAEPQGRQARCRQPIRRLAGLRLALALAPVALAAPAVAEAGALALTPDLPYTFDFRHNAQGLSDLVARLRAGCPLGAPVDRWLAT
jgi:hypothetical protein